MIRDKKIFLSNNIAKLDKDLNSEVKGYILKRPMAWLRRRSNKMCGELTNRFTYKIWC